jgi:phosphohistidine swiveling domain-containing protein
VKPATVVLDGTDIDPGDVGGKGFALNRLISMRAPVPSTGAVTTDGYRWFVRDSGLNDFLDGLRASGPPRQADLDSAADLVDAAFLDAEIPDALAAQILQLSRDVGEGKLLAVRSSATAEDMADASFAGQYRSYLEIGDEEALLRAVKLVWASLWLPAPRAYRAHSKVSEEDLAMSVVIMELVEAERAGVVFTVNPAGSSNDLRIEAVDGLGEQLVSGEVTPEAYALPRSPAQRPSLDPVLDEAVDAALDLERRFGDPQDVEWAHDGSKLFIVQTRPITTATARDDGDGFDTEIGEDHAFTTAGIAESLPGVLPPLQWTTAAPLLENGFRQLFDQMNALPPAADDRPFIARVRGRAVLSLDLMKAAATEVPGGSAEEIERQYFGRVISEPDDSPPGTRARGPFKGLRSMFTGFREINARRSFRFEALTSIDATERLLLAPPNCSVVTAEQLLAYRHRALDLAGRLMAAEIAVAAAAAAAYRGVELFLDPHVGDDAPSLAQRLTAGGIDPCGAQVALHTCDIAEQALSDADLAELISGLSARNPEVLTELATSPQGTELLAVVEEELGRSGSASVFAGETWAESRGLAWQLISQAVQVERSGRREMADAGDRETILRDVESLFATSWKWRFQRVMTGQIVDVRRRMLRRLVGDAVEFLHLREKTKSAVLALGGEIRRIHLELGHRLFDSGSLASPLDVDLLSAQELVFAIDGHGPSPWELDRRREALERMSADESVPQIFVGDPNRRIGVESEPTGDAFAGWGASAGVYVGRARIITKATEPIEPGDILVARTTDPAWTPLFLTAGAIVVEEGGPLSHAAIIARELGLPAVLNVPGLVNRLKTQEFAQLRVDGDSGTVAILSRDSEIDLEDPQEVGGEPEEAEGDPEKVGAEPEERRESVLEVTG